MLVGIEQRGSTIMYGWTFSCFLSFLLLDLAAVYTRLAKSNKH